MSAAIHLHGNAARFGTAQVTTSASLVKLLAMTTDTRMSLCLELAPACALQLAQALQSHAAALVAAAGQQEAAA